MMTSDDAETRALQREIQSLRSELMHIRMKMHLDSVTVNFGVFMFSVCFFFYVAMKVT